MANELEMIHSIDKLHEEEEEGETRNATTPHQVPPPTVYHQLNARAPAALEDLKPSEAERCVSQSNADSKKN